MQTKTLLTTTSLAALTIAATLSAAAIASAQEPGAAGPEDRAERQAVMEQVRDLHEAGNHDEARDLLEESGIRFRPFMRGRNHEKADAVKTAIENNDYQAFAEATADAPFADNINEETFAKLVEAHNLREAGDHEGAKAIMEELGIHPMPFMKHHRGENCENKVEAPAEA